MLPWERGESNEEGEERLGLVKIKFILIWVGLILNGYVMLYISCK
jgi:hypothetical protein